ncbi:hypothetical protein F4774DRAFT_366497 [Daldinia eschscholtzii]|nr:hypothetical protein F4774DRAFT_366497 [Daldinia eschscholtzii]
MQLIAQAYHLIATGTMIYRKSLVYCAIAPGYLLLSFLSFHFALHTSHRRYRLLIFLFFLLFSTLSFISSKYFPVPNFISLWTQSLVLNVVHSTSLIVLENYPVPPQDPKDLSWSSALRETYRVWGNPRMLPRAKESKSGEDEQEEPVAVFLIHRFAKIPLYYFLNWHVLPKLFSETVVELVAYDVAFPALLTRLSDVTAREAVVRSFIALSWIWESLVFLDGTNAVLAVLFVLTGVDQPSDWPPLFGYPTSMCGLRKFWSQFWHKLAVRSYSNYGRTFTQMLAFIIPGMSPAVYGAVIAFVIFLISGLSHAVVSWRLGTSGWLDLQWFLLNFAGCFVETLVVSMIRRLAKKVGWTRELVLLERSWLGWFIGYTWVFAFFFWTVPLWKFPTLYRELVKLERWASILSKMTIVEG